MSKQGMSFYYLSAYEEGDWLGKEPVTPAHFLDLVKGEIDEANFGPTKNLHVFKPGRLIGRVHITPENGKPYVQNLYKVRVYGPKEDIKIILDNIRHEYGDRRTGGRAEPEYLRKLGWEPV
jgi:hypothetical protein